MQKLEIWQKNEDNKCSRLKQFTTATEIEPQYDKHNENKKSDQK